MCDTRFFTSVKLALQIIITYLSSHVSRLLVPKTLRDEAVLCLNSSPAVPTAYSVNHEKRLILKIMPNKIFNKTRLCSNIFEKLV